MIVEFAAYWAVQTIELWDTPDRRERLPAEMQHRLQEERTTGGGFTAWKSEMTEARVESPGARLLPLL